MLRFALASRNVVNVAVDSRAQHAQTVDPGLLGGLGQRHRGQMALAVRVATGLQPQAELGVQHQQRPFAVVVDHQRRAGQVPGQTAPMKGIGMLLGERQDLVAVAI